MLFFSAACDAIDRAAWARGPDCVAVAEHVAVAGAVHAATRGERAGVERARFKKRKSRNAQRQDFDGAPGANGE